MQVQQNRGAVCQLNYPLAYLSNGLRVGHAGGIRQCDFIYSEIQLFFDDIKNDPGVDGALKSASKDTLQTATDGQPPLLSDFDHVCKPLTGLR